MGSPLGLSFKNENNGIQSVSGTNFNYRVVDGKAVQSLFGNGQFSPYPTSTNVASGSVEKMNGPTEIHSDERNDISISSIIAYCAQHPAMKLDYAHFAYLKNVGVYPNNRLIIARRFGGGVGNDLTAMTGQALATIVTYFGETEECFSITFNEEYTAAEGSFEEVLNDIGDDILSGDNKGGKLGTEAAGGFGIIPLPGIMEGVQHIILNKLGLSNIGGPGDSPLGNPNLIREAQQRAIPGKGKAGTALAAKFSVKMTIEYEQKFINGVDPTLVYLDIIQNALTFGTSKSVFQFSNGFGQGVSGFIQSLISGDLQAITSAITQFVTSLISAISESVQNLVNQLITALDSEKEAPKDETPDQKKQREKDGIAAAGQAIIGLLGKVSQATIGTIVSRYKVRLLGIANALTGAPSTPWHVTIGNPKKPIFSSGDMLCSSVNLSLGPTLAFNDLPSTIKLEIELTNARSLGSQEIFNRFNTGKGRSYVSSRISFVEANDALIQESVSKKVDELNKTNNSDTQKPAPTSKTTNETAAVANNSSNNPVTDNKDKNNVTNTETKVPVDDYIVDFTDPKAGVEWGTKQTEPPPANKVVTGDSTTVQPQSTTEVKPSNQSQNNPSTPTSGIPLATDSSITPPSPLIPGVPSTTTPLPIGIVAPEFLPPTTGLPLTVPGAPSTPVILPTNPDTTTATASPAVEQLNAGISQSSPPPPENIPAKTTESAVWERGKRVNRGSFNEGDIKVSWEVKQGNLPGSYDLSWTSSGGVYGTKKFNTLTGQYIPNPSVGQSLPDDSDEWTTDGTLEYATNMVKEQAYEEFGWRKNGGI
jgi:hypothetical protein